MNVRELKYHSYEPGYARAYFKTGKDLVCIQPGHNYLPELMACTKDGEPSHAMGIDMFEEYDIQLEFTNMPPDGDTWTWRDILAFFNSQDITSNGMLMRRMNGLFEINE